MIPIQYLQPQLVSIVYSSSRLRITVGEKKAEVKTPKKLPAKYAQVYSKHFGKYKSVLVLSVDGLRESDLTDPKLQAYLPNITNLQKTGITYTNAFTAIPSDSFPGTLAYFTGAGPLTTGVYYDSSYDRTLKAPDSSSLGTEVTFDESIDKDSTLLRGGGNFSTDSIDQSKLPIDANGNPVYPHNYLKVNTVFEVAKEAGLRTAYAEKHPAYDLLNGPSGKGVDDLYTPEINATVAIINDQLVDKSTAPQGTTFKTVTKDIKITEIYDDLKVNAVINEIQGLTSSGKSYVDANEETLSNPPAIFGTNFQAVSVSEKLPGNGIAADGTPSAGFIDALGHTDASVGKIVDALKQKNQFDSTLVVLTAKHGQNPRLQPVTLLSEDTFTAPLTAAGITVVHNVPDDASIIWLQDPSQAAQAKDILTKLNNPNVEQILIEDDLVKFGFGNPLTDNRAPSLVVKLKPGVVLVSNPNNPSKVAEHGGYSEDDTHVPLILISGGLNASVKGSVQTKTVSNKQIAVTILEALGLNPKKLQGVRVEHTPSLPGTGIEKR
ncbi:alkaline phosphatase family protein [Brasilonema sp. CT11]|nr:alkaline phosphatase family protein [Brasilonema sp. CT11]